MKKFYIIFLTLLQSCWIPGKDITAFYTVIEKSNASEIQKKGLWEGCVAGHSAAPAPTAMRDISDLFIDETGISDGEYKNAFSYGFYYCMKARSSLTGGSYTRLGWNLIGFKGDKIAYKSET